jgi:hypothetical protein
MLIGRFSMPQLSIEKFVQTFKCTMQWERLQHSLMRIGNGTKERTIKQHSKKTKKQPEMAVFCCPI